MERFVYMYTYVSTMFSHVWSVALQLLPMPEMLSAKNILYRKVLSIIA